MKKTRRRLLIEHLATFGSITRQEALQYYGIQNLADLVMKLRRMGWTIDKRYVTVEGQRICRYVMDPVTIYAAFATGTLVEVEGRFEAPYE